MPGPWTGLRALAAASGYQEAFLDPEAAWADDEPVSDFTQTDLLWWKPVEPADLPKNQLLFGFHLGSSYHMYCRRCETKWLAEANTVPRCWNCGKFVSLNENFKKERKELRQG